MAGVLKKRDPVALFEPEGVPELLWKGDLAPAADL